MNLEHRCRIWMVTFAHKVILFSTKRTMWWVIEDAHLYESVIMWLVTYVSRFSFTMQCSLPLVKAKHFSLWSIWIHQTNFWGEILGEKQSANSLYSSWNIFFLLSTHLSLHYDRPAFHYQNQKYNARKYHKKWDQNKTLLGATTSTGIWQMGLQCIMHSLGWSNKESFGKFSEPTLVKVFCYELQSTVA